MERRLAVILNVLISCKALCSISILFMLPSAACYCIRTYYARPFEQTISHKGYSNDQHCSFTIEPSARYNGNNNGTSHFFLEITWKHFFDVKGTMPHCENDYVEVFLTRLYKPIGRFCSNNLVQQNGGKILFDMYSYDGYAKIEFHSDSLYTGNGFAVGYKLREIANDYIGVSDCATNTMFWYKNFFSMKWPREYNQGPSCNWRISEEGTKKIIFMDLDLRYESTATSCHKPSDDYIEIRGAKGRTSFGAAKHLKGPICGTSSIVTYTTSYKWVAIQLIQHTSQTGQLSSASKRGFIAGYVIYTTGTKSYSKRTSPVVMSIGVIMGVLILLTVGCCMACLIRHKRRRMSHVQRTTNSAASPHTTTTYAYHAPDPGLSTPTQPRTSVPNHSDPSIHQATATTTCQSDAPPKAPPSYADCVRAAPLASDDPLGVTTTTTAASDDDLPPPYDDVL